MELKWCSEIHQDSFTVNQLQVETEVSKMWDWVLFERTNGLCNCKNQVQILYPKFLDVCLVVVMLSTTKLVKPEILRISRGPSHDTNLVVEIRRSRASSGRNSKDKQRSITGHKSNIFERGYSQWHISETERRCSYIAAVLTTNGLLTIVSTRYQAECVFRLIDP
jgi:hypothetical protein